jgi:Ca-activated chloride channel homolog
MAGLVLSACSERPKLTMIAGSEIKDLEAILKETSDKAGFDLIITYSGTLDGVERIAAGEAFDLAWFSHAKYLQLTAPQAVQASERIMLSPVIVGVKPQTVTALGWRNKPVTWRAIAEAANAGRFKFAMTSPTASNSGFTALMGLHAALKGDNALLTGFFKGQALTAGSSGWLADSFVRDQGQLDGMVNYESVLLNLNRSNKLQQKLELIYPQEGIVTADYPLVLLKSAQREPYQKLVDALRSEDTQKRIMNETLRRPANSSVALAEGFPKPLMVELEFPATAAAVNDILGRYLSQQRRPAHSVFVLDVSGSMEGERFNALKNSIKRLAGDDTSLSGRYAIFQPREKVSLITFAGEVDQPVNFLVNSSNDRQQIKAFVDRMSLRGGTAIYDGLKVGYDLANRAKSQDASRSYSLVLMTDGENNNGNEYNDFERFYSKLSAQARGIRVFPILFGEGNSDEMNNLAALTGGRVFDGRKSLEGAFKEIRGYQ